jgi:chemotaxis protein CheD
MPAQLHSFYSLGTGELAIAKDYGEISIMALGSCMAAFIYNPVLKIGGGAHILLPGKARNADSALAFRYAENAIAELIHRLYLSNDLKGNYYAALIGGGNVLKREQDAICYPNVRSVEAIMLHHSIPVVARAYGGHMRRSARLNISTGELRYTEGDSKERPLFHFGQVNRTYVNELTYGN